jgi:1,4-dihydroxy-2-naphthoate octaprenyltransferase
MVMGLNEILRRHLASETIAGRCAPVLHLGAACMLLGSVWLWAGVSVQPWRLLLVWPGGGGSHRRRAFNEYFDFKSGLDARTQRTPFSGGSGTLQMHPESVRSALITAILSLIIVGLVGLYFTFIWGAGLLPLGILGMITIVVYTTTFLRSHSFP